MFVQLVIFYSFSCCSFNMANCIRIYIKSNFDIYFYMLYKLLTLIWRYLFWPSCPYSWGMLLCGFCCLTMWALGPGEVTHLVKCLPQKHKDVSLNPSEPTWRLRVVVHSYSPHGMRRWRKLNLWCSLAREPSWTDELQVWWETLFLKVKVEHKQE